MKVTAHSLDRVRDTVTLRMQARDNMRRPVKITVTVEPDDGLSSPVISGDVRQLNGLLAGFAEAAWANGWRPAGLAGTIAAVIGNFKIPKQEG